MTHVADGRWYRQPVLWLAAVIFFASLAGCIHIVVLGARYADEPLNAADERLLKMPTTRAADRELIIAPES